MQHLMPINDINHAWSEDRVYGTSEGVTKFTVWCGRCTCGVTFEAKDSATVTRLWAVHVYEAEHP